MKFILYSDIDEKSIRKSLGRPEYSYYFVLKAFRPALEKLGSIILTKDPENDLDAIYDDCTAEGEPCLFVSFAPPHRTLVDHRCPTIVVVAWEFSTIPNEVWSDDPRDDWRYVFARHGRAISLSSHTARVVREAMGEDYPIVGIATPVWDRFQSLYARLKPTPVVAGITLSIDGLVLDSREMSLSPDYLLHPPPPLPGAEATQAEAPAATLEVEVTTEAAPEVAMTPAPEGIAEPEPPPEPVVLETQVEAAQIVEPPPSPESIPFRKTLRYRLGVTKHFALEWYREAVRDLLPRWLAWLLSRFGRLLYWPVRVLKRQRLRNAAAAAPALPETIDAPAIIEETTAPELLVEPQQEPEAELASEPEPIPEIPPPEPEPAPVRQKVMAHVALDGVVYTSVLNPKDGRKNWADLITAFCWAFRDTEDATLVLKIVQGNLAVWYHPLVQMLSQLSPFKCRVVTLHGFLEDEEYERLIEATSYYVNASCCEGLCMPLMEFMSCGKPAVAPCHTAMEDYIDSANAFIVDASMEHNVWPHDPRDRFRTERYRIDWGSLMDAYRESYRVAKEDGARYAAMGDNAWRTMKAYCAEDVVAERIGAFIGSSGLEPSEPGIEAGEAPLVERDRAVAAIEALAQ